MPVPRALQSGPFTQSEAFRVGVTRRQLQGSSYRRLGARLYCWAGVKDSPMLRLTAIARRLPSGAALSGKTAAWLHGIDVEPCDPIEVTIPESFQRSRVPGASVRRAALNTGEIVRRSGLPRLKELSLRINSFALSWFRSRGCGLTLTNIQEPKA